jgi:hypothetical protein
VAADLLRPSAADNRRAALVAAAGRPCSRSRTFVSLMTGRASAANSLAMGRAGSDRHPLERLPLSRPSFARTRALGSPAARDAPSARKPAAGRLTTRALLLARCRAPCCPEFPNRRMIRACHKKTPAIAEVFRAADGIRTHDLLQAIRARVCGELRLVASLPASRRFSRLDPYSRLAAVSGPSVAFVLPGARRLRARRTRRPVLA